MQSELIISAHKQHVFCRDENMQRLGVALKLIMNKRLKKKGKKSPNNSDQQHKDPVFLATGPTDAEIKLFRWKFNQLGMTFNTPLAGTAYLRWLA